LAAPEPQPSTNSPLQVLPSTPAVDAPDEVHARMFGTFVIELAGEEVGSWRGTKARSVLRYLVAHRERPVAKELLQEVLWPEIEPDVGRRNLHQAVYTLRQTLRRFEATSNLVLFEHDCYFLNPEIPLWCDVEAFEAGCVTGRRHEEAGRTLDAADAYRTCIGLYTGDFLEDASYDEWTMVQRNGLRMAFVEVAHRLGDLLMRRGATDEAIEVSQRLLSVDPADEAAHRRIMSCQHARGQRGLALRQYQACVDAVRLQYSLPPSSETAALLELIRS